MINKNNIIYVCITTLLFFTTTVIYLFAKQLINYSCFCNCYYNFSIASIKLHIYNMCYNTLYLGTVTSL